jgi:predicted  nucleic acid-binding Zn-ribbon protein
VNDSVLALPFDQYQRYRLVADLLRQLRAGGPPLRVLDVGGRTAVLREFFDDARIDLVDVESSDARGLVLGDGSRLPFVDAAFDAVCAFDTLEHVPRDVRADFVAECRRVARRWVVLAGPYKSARVEEAEALLQRFLESKLGERHRYLDEHRHHGLPERAVVEAQLARLGAKTVAIGHANLDRWLVLQCLSMYMDYDRALRGIARDFQRFYNAALYASDHAEPVYRHIVVAALDGARLPDARALLDAPVAPAGALKSVFDLGAELVQFDRERSAWRSERAEFRRVVEALESDLSGHRQALADVRAMHEHAMSTIAGDREALRQFRSDLERGLAAALADLAGHRRALADLRSSEEGLQAELANVARERDALAKLRVDLESDLAGHRRLVDDLQSDLQGHRQALEQVQAQLGGALADLAGRRSEIAGLNTELGDERRRRAELESAGARHRARAEPGAARAGLREPARGAQEPAPQLDARVQAAALTRCVPPGTDQNEPRRAGQPCRAPAALFRLRVLPGEVASLSRLARTRQERAPHPRFVVRGPFSVEV